MSKKRPRSTLDEQPLFYSPFEESSGRRRGKKSQPLAHTFVVEDLTPRRKRSSAPRAKLVNVNAEEPSSKRQRTEVPVLEPEPSLSSTPLFDITINDDTDQFHAYDEFEGVVFEHNVVQERSRKVSNDGKY